MGTASFFVIAIVEMFYGLLHVFRNDKKDIVDSRLGCSTEATNLLLLKNYKKLPSNENGNKSRIDFVLMISPFGAAK